MLLCETPLVAKLNAAEPVMVRVDAPRKLSPPPRARPRRLVRLRRAISQQQIKKNKNKSEENKKNNINKFKETTSQNTEKSMRIPKSVSERKSTKTQQDKTKRTPEIRFTV
jgi:preprotein translocase subunit SecD